MDKEKIIEEVKGKALKAFGVDHASVDIQEYDTDNHFYTTRRDIFDSSEYWFEDVIVDFDLWVQSEVRVAPHAEITEYILESLEIDNADLLQEDIDYLEKEDLTYDKCSQQTKDLIDNRVSMVEYEDVRDNDDLAEYLGVECAEERFNELEALAYWTVYFSPAYAPANWEEIAHQCNLLPFEYEGERYLALGGCGMDLSPRLDAFQALVAETLPTGSTFFSQPEYAKSVAWSQNVETALNLCRREKPSVVVRFDLDVEDDASDNKETE